MLLSYAMHEWCAYNTYRKDVVEWSNIIMSIPSHDTHTIIKSSDDGHIYRLSIERVETKSKYSQTTQ